MTNAATLTKSYWAKQESIVRKWHWLDAKGIVLGRLSTRIAMLLMGKTKADYTPSIDCGDFVVVTNADKIHLTGKKMEDKIIFHHTAHPGGARFTNYKKLLADRPEKILYLAVKRMLPKNKLASRQILRMKIYCAETHPHTAQNPVKLGLAS